MAVKEALENPVELLMDNDPKSLGTVTNAFLILYEQLKEPRLFFWLMNITGLITNYELRITARGVQRRTGEVK